MQSTGKNHPDIWKEFLEGNFCVTKNEIPFTSIAPDHALEQENRRLKVSGGIIRITQNENALKRFFLIAPELERICTMFEESFFINSSSSRVQHHDIESTKLKRMNKNKARLQDIIEQHGDPFISSSSDMNNLLTHAVLPENVAKDVINLVKCGRRTGCSRNCSCRRNKISCTELCKCFQSSCNNSHNRIEDDVFVDNEDHGLL